MLHVPMLEALHLPTFTLQILFNEARRQRAIDVGLISMGVWGTKESKEQLEKDLKVHGPYTEGFYEEERKRLMEVLGGETAQRKD